MKEGGKSTTASRLDRSQRSKNREKKCSADRPVFYYPERPCLMSILVRRRFLLDAESREESSFLGFLDSRDGGVGGQKH
jgi:hypothetical protein